MNVMAQDLPIFRKTVVKNCKYLDLVKLKKVQGESKAIAMAYTKSEREMVTYHSKVTYQKIRLTKKM